MDQPVDVKLAGGREVTGVLKGFDLSLNLVLDETREYVRNFEDPSKRSLIPDPASPDSMVEETRFLGVVVCKGTLVLVVSPYDGTEEIENPFAGE
nr:LSm7 [Diplonema papillatum]